MDIDASLTPADLLPAIERLAALAPGKVRAIDETWEDARGAPVFTVEGRYAAKGWTQWTQGFQYGCALLAFDLTNDHELLELGRSRTLERMTPHLTHTGVHDHAFNNLSTYGQLRRLMLEGRFEHDEWELRFYELAIKASAAVQASRWTALTPKDGYIYSFNGPHSLFIDTMRTLRILGLAHQLGHVLMGEGDRRISLLDRLIQHALTSAAHLIAYSGDKDHYAMPGRLAHEAIFNVTDSSFRCLSTQQGYSPFSTWTRGLAWAILGFAEELEFLRTIAPESFKQLGRTREVVFEACSAAALATANHYLDHASTSDGLCYWDTGAPGLAKIGDWQSRPADPFNEHEPVDASAAAIAAQGLIRLGKYLGEDKGKRFSQAGLTITRTLLAEPYLATDEHHHGLLLHCVYHRPRGWDHVPPGSTPGSPPSSNIPRGEATMWGDYHLLELASLVHRLATDRPYPTFFDRGGV